MTAEATRKKEHDTEKRSVKMRASDSKLIVDNGTTAFAAPVLKTVY